jgi:hypothetical protein
MIRSFGPLAIILAVVAAGPAAAQQATVVTSDQAESVGLSLTIPGAADAAAIAAATSGGAAFGDAVVGQALVGNTVTQTNIASLSAIDQSINDNVGIIDVNQDSGNFNNQANVVAIAVAQSGGTVVGATAVAFAQRSGNTLITSGGSSEDRITGSFNNTTGLVAVNQSSGSLNQQVNVVVIGLGANVGSTDALSDSALAGVSGATDNTLKQGAARSRADVIDGSFGNFHGIAQVNQSAGDLNVISNTLAVSVTEMTLP